MNETSKLTRLTKDASERRDYPKRVKEQVYVSERHVTQQPDRRRAGAGGNFTLTIAQCDGGADVKLTFVNGLLTNDGSEVVYSGCGGGGGSA